MRIATVALTAFLFCIAPFSALAATDNESEFTVLGRLGTRNTAVYHYTEIFRARGRFIFPDFGYIDFGKSNYREFFTGGGLTVLAGRRVLWIQEFYLEWAAGSGSRGEKWLVPWTLMNVNLAPKLNWETCYFPYLPLNEQGRIQHVLERSKIEYNFKRFRMGAGYGAYQFGDEAWTHRPFVSVTVKTGKIGDLEFWLQKIPAGPQLQVRYSYSFRKGGW